MMELYCKSFDFDFILDYQYLTVLLHFFYLAVLIVLLVIYCHKKFIFALQNKKKHSTSLFITRLSAFLWAAHLKLSKG